MNGHQQIIELRRNNLKPSFVWISDSCSKIKTDLTVDIEPNETPELLDFRFLSGVTAFVEGFDKDRVQRIAKSCEKYAARVIATTFVRNGNFIDAICTTDTEGVATWQA